MALASAYALGEKSFKEYKDKVVETVGGKTVEKIQDSLAQDKIDKDKLVMREVQITNKGNTLCYDTISGRYFYNDIESMRKVMNDLNLNLISEMWVPLNHLYYGLGLSGIAIGDDIGWSIDKPIELEFRSMIAENNEPCLVLGYRTLPEGF